jgi:hypothetical protein
LVLQLHGSSVLAAQRVALVIGNSAYAALEHVRTASKDAEAVADALTRLNFSVIADTDSDQRSMRVFIRQFTDAIEKTDIALIYFSGRAIQENGVNYLLPVDARISRPEDVPLEGVDLSALVRQIGRSHAKRIIMVDAASDGPGGDQKQRSLFQGSGLAAMEPAEETLIGFAAEPGSVAPERSGEHSAFTAAILQYIENRDLDFDAVMMSARQQVIEATSGRQRPWIASSLAGSIALGSRPNRARPKPGGTPGGEGTGPLKAPPEAAVRLDFGSAQQVGTPAAWRAFVAKYGERSDQDSKFYVELARAALSKAEPASVSVRKRSDTAPAQRIVKSKSKPERRAQRATHNPRANSKQGASKPRTREPAKAGRGKQAAPAPAKSPAARMGVGNADRAALCRRLLNGPPPSHRHRRHAGRMLLYNEFCRGP